MKPKLLMLTRHQRLGSSSRLRLMAYRPFLESQGWSVSVGHFFDDRYLLRFNAGQQRSRTAVLSALLRRLQQLYSAKHFDLLWIEKELFPFFPGFLERLPQWKRIAYVVDYDDATFHRYDQHSSSVIRRLLGNKLTTLLRSAETVTCCNPYLARMCLAKGAKQVIQIPTVVDPSRYRMAQRPACDELRIGWIGSPTTAQFLALIREPLEALASRLRMRFVIIGAAQSPKLDIPIERHSWAEETESQLLQTLDIGVMPLSDTLWEQGKCGYKLIQYMASGLPVVASSVGVNRSVVSADTGFLVKDQAEWLQALIRLGYDPELRAALGKAGRRRVEQRYSLQVTAPLVTSVLSEALARARHQ